MKYLPCRPRIEPSDSENARDEKPHLTEIFRHLGVTSGPALKPFSDDQLHRVGFHLLVFHHPHFQLLVWRGLVDHQMAFSGVVYRIRQSGSNLILVRRAWALRPISRLKNGRRNEVEKYTQLRSK
jgi:hypothetical protein